MTEIDPVSRPADPAAQWKPNVTVAALVQRQDRFLLVRERSIDGPVLNQPAGHLEPGESFEQAVRRETLEESGWLIAPRSVVGLYLWRSASNGITYLRVCFAGEPVEHDDRRPLDDGILGTEWLTLAELRQSIIPHRSPLVLRCVEDFLAGHAFPLHILHHCLDAGAGRVP